MKAEPIADLLAEQANALATEEDEADGSMTNLERFSLHSFGPTAPANHMDRNPEGKWVRFEDVQRASSQLANDLIEFDAWLSFRPEFKEVKDAFRKAFNTNTGADA